MQQKFKNGDLLVPVEICDLLFIVLKIAGRSRVKPDLSKLYDK